MILIVDKKVHIYVEDQDYDYVEIQSEIFNAAFILFLAQDTVVQRLRFIQLLSSLVDQKSFYMLRNDNSAIPAFILDYVRSNGQYNEVEVNYECE